MVRKHSTRLQLNIFKPQEPTIACDFVAFCCCFLCPFVGWPWLVAFLILFFLLWKRVSCLSVLYCLVLMVILVGLLFVCAPLPRPLGDIGWSFLFVCAPMPRTLGGIGWSMICLCSIASSSWWHCLVYDLSVIHCLVLLVTLVGLWFVCAPFPRQLGDVGWSMICLCSIASPSWWHCLVYDCLCSIASSSWWHWLVYYLSVLHCLVILVTLVGLWFVCAPLPRHLGDIGRSMICLCSIALYFWWHLLIYYLSVVHCLVSWSYWLVFFLFVCAPLPRTLDDIGWSMIVCAPLPRPLGDIGWSMICLCSIASSSWWHWLVYDLSVLHCLVFLVTLFGLWFVCAQLACPLGDIGWSFLFACAPLPRTLGDIGWSMICLCSIASSSWWHCLVYGLSMLNCLVLLVTLFGLWFVCAQLPCLLGDIGWSMICLCSIASSSWWHWLVYDLSVLHCLVLLVTLVGLLFVCAPLPRPLVDIDWSIICLCSIASSSWWYWLVYDLSVLHCLVFLVTLVSQWFVCAPLPRPLCDIGWSMIWMCSIASSSWWYWSVYDLSVLHCLVILVTLVGLWFVCAPLPRHLGDIGWSMICLCSIASYSLWYWLIYDLSVLHCLVLLVTLIGLFICLCSIASSSWWQWLVYDLSVLHCLVILVTLVGLWFVCAPLPCPLGDIGWSMICLCSIASSSWWHWLVYDLSVLNCLVLLVILVGLWFVCAPLPRPLGDIDWSIYLSVLDCLVLLVTMVGLWFVCAPLPRHLGDIGWSWFVCAPLPRHLGDNGWSMICLCSIASSSWWHWLVYDLSVLHCLVLLVTLVGLWFVCALLPCPLGDIVWSMICLCSIASSSWWH